MAKKIKLKYWIIAIIILFVAAVVFLVVQMQKKSYLEDQLNRSQTAKEQVTNELDNLYNQYDELETENDSISAQLQNKKERIKQLQSEVREVKLANKREIEEYKEEVKMLRKIMRGYVRTIDSLNQANKRLMAENKAMKNEYQEVKVNKEQLEQEKEKLSSKVKKASKLKIEDITGQFIKKNGGDTKWPMFAHKVEVCFTIEKNEIAESGERTFFLRVLRPDDFILTDSKEKLFKYGGKQIAYSARRNIDYNGKEKEMCIFYKLQGEEKPMSGTYHGDIFIENRKVGEVSFELR